MEFEIYSHRNAKSIIDTNEKLNSLWNELRSVIESISDDEIAETFLSSNREAKSISETINKLLDKKLSNLNWNRQSPIFKDPAYADRGRRKSNWRLDFAKNDFAIEVAFNHANDIAWNLIKPVLSSELNHVAKAIQTSIGIIVTANQNLKESGGFDHAIGTFEKYVEYLKPLNQILTSPLLVVGLDAPKSIYIEKEKKNGKIRGKLLRKF